MRTFFLTLLVVPFFAFASETPRGELIAQGKTLKTQGDYAGAEALYKGWLQNHPGDFDVSFSLAQVLYWQDKYEESLSYLDALLAKDPMNQDVQIELVKVHSAMADSDMKVFRLSAETAGYDFFNDNSGGGKANFSWTRRGEWALRAMFHGFQKFNLSGAEGAIGGSYWFGKQWSVDQDFSLASRAEVVAQFSSVTGVNYRFVPDMTASFAFRYSGYDVANVFIFSPSYSWSLSKYVSLDAKLFAAITRFDARNQTVATASGLVRANFVPYDYFSLFIGASAGQEAFDPANPEKPQTRFINAHGFGGMKFAVTEHIGMDFSVDYEWRNNSQSITSGEIGVSYNW